MSKRTESLGHTPEGQRIQFEMTGALLFDRLVDCDAPGEVAHA